MVAVAITSSSTIPVHVFAADPLTRAGIMSQLRTGQGFMVSSSGAPDTGGVAVVVADEVTETVVAEIRGLRARGAQRVILLVGRVNDQGLLAAAEAGVSGVVRREEATAHNLGTAIRSAARGEGTLPPDLLGRLLRHVGQIQRQVLSPRGLTFSGLTERETAVLRLLAEGYGTAEVGQKLFYSERTVKNIIHDVTTRLELRNRAHAVAYAIREGLI
jgi:DNA-binding NarL/FixJ family response regulator